MKLFNPKWLPSVEGPIEGDNAYALPLVVCPHCNNKLGYPGICYPWLDLAQIFEPSMEKRLRGGIFRPRGVFAGHFSWDDFKLLQTKIRAAMGNDNLPLPPGASFGSLYGKLFKKSLRTDFVIPNYCALLARREVVQKLNELGNNLRCFEIKLKPHKNENTDYVQIWAPPTGKSGRSSGSVYCPHCERGSGRVAFIVEEPEEGCKDNIFVLKDDLSPVVFTEKLANDIKFNNFSGLNLELTPSEKRI